MSTIEEDAEEWRLFQAQELINRFRAEELIKEFLKTLEPESRASERKTDD